MEIFVYEAGRIHLASARLCSKNYYVGTNISERSGKLCHWETNYSTSNIHSANITEAQAAISRKEFVLCMNVAKREAKETVNWLEIIKKSLLTSHSIEPYIQESLELVRILVSIVTTVQLGNKK